MDTSRTPWRQPAAWKAEDFAGKDDLAVDLEARHLDAFHAALRGVRNRGLTLEQMGRHDFMLPAIADEVAEWRREVANGRGLLLLRGFPLERYSQTDVELIWFGLGTHLGRAVSQSTMGDRLGHVVNIGGLDNKERAYRNARELALHTDRCDTVGMFCLQKAWRGGISGYTSALTVYNEMLASRPDLLEVLCEGFHYHRFGEQPPGEPPVTPVRVPVFSESEGVPTTVYLRGYAEMAANEFGVSLGEQGLEALDYFDEVANRPELRLDFLIEPGEAAFFNNGTILHRRTGFEDHEDPARARHLLRLWLMDWEARPTVPAVRTYKGEGGILKQPGKSTYYAARR